MEDKKTTEIENYNCGIPYIYKSINRISEIMLKSTDAYKKGAMNGFTTGVSLAALIIAIVSLFAK